MNGLSDCRSNESREELEMRRHRKGDFLSSRSSVIALYCMQIGGMESRSDSDGCSRSIGRNRGEGDWSGTGFLPILAAKPILWLRIALDNL